MKYDNSQINDFLGDITPEKYNFLQELKKGDVLMDGSEELEFKSSEESKDPGVFTDYNFSRLSDGRKIYLRLWESVDIVESYVFHENPWKIDDED